MENLYIRRGLLEVGQNQKWLIDRLRDRGIPTSKTELSSVLAGKRTGPKADKILTTTVQILDAHGYHGD